MPPDVQITPMTRADIDAIFRAFVSWNKTRGQYEHYYAENEAGQRVTFVARRNGHVIGYSNVLWVSDYAPFTQAGIPEISDLNVVVEAQKQGVGTAPIEACEAAMRHAGKRTVGIGVGQTDDYENAQRLYPQLGYVYEDAPPVSTPWGDTRYLTKRL